MTPLKYPFAPLAGVMGMSESQAAKQLGVSGRVEQEYRRVGMSEKVADRLAIRAGFHPAVIWPEWAEDQAAALPLCGADGCEQRFFPRDKQSRFCSATCRRREKMRRYRQRPNGVEANRRHRRAYYWSARDYELDQARKRRAA